MEGFRIFLFALALVCQCQWVMSNKCQKGFFDDGKGGCEKCGCCSLGSTKTECDSKGVCPCKPEWAGDKCSDCSDGYWLVKTRCQKCGCFLLGSINVKCNLVGRCKCKDPSFQGDKCLCPNGNFVKNDKCLPCKCSPTGSANATCANGAGQCHCLPGYEGTQCSGCSDGYFSDNLKCKACNCQPGGSSDSKCDGSGQCTCKPGNTGKQCGTCLNGFYQLADGSCRDCKCNKIGTKPGEFCDANGICPCKASHKGDTCNQCNAGYRKVKKQCKPKKGSKKKPAQQGGGQQGGGQQGGGQQGGAQQGGAQQGGAQQGGAQQGGAQQGGSSAFKCTDCVKANKKGCILKQKKCTCKNNFGGRLCDICKANFYKNQNKCKGCGCLRHGQQKPCNATTGVCYCKPPYNGDAKCKKCAKGYRKHKKKFCKKIPNAGAQQGGAQQGGAQQGGAQQGGAQQGGAQQGGSSAFKCTDCVKANKKGCLIKKKRCTCKNNFGGRLCDVCKVNFYKNQNKCKACGCGKRGQQKPCNSTTGVCYCKPVYRGNPKCKKCIKGYTMKKGICRKNKG